MVFAMLHGGPQPKIGAYEPSSYSKDKIGVAAVLAQVPVYKSEYGKLFVAAVIWAMFKFPTVESNPQPPRRLSVDRFHLG